MPFEGPWRLRKEGNDDPQLLGLKAAASSLAIQV
jgi:hypothetical protein